MDNSSQPNDSRKCMHNCEQLFRECLLDGKEEVFCRIQRVPCDSSCSEL
jgi:hypothetical protein